MVSETVELRGVSISASTEKALKEEGFRLRSFREDPAAEPPPPDQIPWQRQSSIEEIAARVLEQWAVIPRNEGAIDLDRPQEEDPSHAAISICISSSAAAVLEAHARKLNEGPDHAPTGPRRSAPVAGKDALSRLAAEDVGAEVLRVWALDQATT
jgi:hypothetical protein